MQWSIYSKSLGLGRYIFLPLWGLIMRCSLCLVTRQFIHPYDPHNCDQCIGPSISSWPVQYSWVFLLHQKSLRELGKAETLLTAMSWCQLCLEKAHPRKMLAPAHMLWDKEQGLVSVTCFCRLLVESIRPDRKSTCGFFCSPFWFKKKNMWIFS